ncbi:MAG: adenylyl-sulfate kinase [Deltaproteobacteria bacterium]|jgi:adenylyl-sulfate kinase|nr:adenylyl-sulfate kinase [Deltaproteobacteria bacterium]
MDFAAQHIIAPRSHVSQEMREARQLHKGMAFWLTGLSGAGKSTLAHAVELEFFQRGYSIVVLDGDVIRTGLCRDLGFSPEERAENNRRVAELAKVLVRNATICLCAFISPLAEARRQAGEIVGREFFREVFVRCSVEECERRDAKGFYARARQGTIKNYTGISAEYEPPLRPDLVICTENNPVEKNIAELLAFVERQSSKT